MGKARRRKLLRREQSVPQDSVRHVLPSDRKTALWIALILFVAGCITYAKTFTNAFTWDDIWQIAEAKDVLLIRNIGGIFSNGVDFIYRPLFFTVLAVINSLFGTNAVYFHIFSILIHIANAFLVYVLLRRFFSGKTALFGSLLFLLHPIQVEAVANISFLTEPLSFFFGCLTLLTVMYGRTTHAFFGCFLFFLFSMLSKESGIVFFPVIASYCMLFRRDVLIKAVLSLSAGFGVYLFLRLGVARSPLFATFPIAPYVPIQRASPGVRLLTVPAIVGYYFRTFFFPLKLAVAQYWVVKQVTISNFFLPLAGMIAMIGAAWYALRYFRAKNGHAFRILLFFVLWFGMGLLFYLQIVPLTMTVADRWMYMPVAGLIGIICVLAAEFLPKRPGNLLVVVATGMCVLLAVRSMVRTFDWQDNLTLFSHDTRVTPGNFSLENDIGAELLKRGQYGEAKRHLDASIALAPDWWLNWTNLGTYFNSTHDADGAIRSYETAIRNGKNTDAYVLYSLMLLNEPGKFSTQSALQILTDGISVHPKSAQLWGELAVTYYRLGKKNEASEAAMTAYRLSNARQYADLALAIQQGKVIEFAP